MYNLIFSDEAYKYLSRLPKKDQAHVKEVVELCLQKYLKEKTKRCNSKLLKGSRKNTHRLHVSMTHTIFPAIDDKNNRVLIDDIMSINQAHKKYGLV